MQAQVKLCQSKQLKLNLPAPPRENSDPQQKETKSTVGHWAKDLGPFGCSLLQPQDPSCKVQKYLLTLPLQMSKVAQSWPGSRTISGSNYLAGVTLSQVRQGCQVNDKYVQPGKGKVMQLVWRHQHQVRRGNLLEAVELYWLEQPENMVHCYLQNWTKSVLPTA